MCESVDQDLTPNTSTVPKAAWRRIWPSRDGAAAIEFAILAIPYFMIVFAIIETFVAFTAEQLVSNAVETLSRQLRTGQITTGLGRSTDKTQTEFRKLFCDEIAILIQCSAEEIATPDKLYLDVRTFSTFANIPTTIPRKSSDTYADIDTTSFGYSPGGAKSINMVRAYYRWQIITDLVRPYITNIRPTDGSVPNYFLIVATSAFQNEDYP
ncbi:TadE/TadG family type IV pilus assembly protein [Rhizobium sp. SL86]|uniref:TadE/TadG family type IV pilus assembly protein n=1 Tax=Rhizobium sp. SL86 TaxID=2995148 RepID=UPI002274E4DE|nr:TadE/TadG family type IV pilus assembly protein [Rhizobium sp. SL86]MCY1665134.1 pilus assembly protein [Rhizobium sp. SL86]